jgi:hypothetical protein
MNTISILKMMMMMMMMMMIIIIIITTTNEKGKVVLVFNYLSTMP